MIPYIVLGHDAIMAAGPGLTFTVLVVAAYAIYVNMRSKK